MWLQRSSALRASRSAAVVVRRPRRSPAFPKVAWPHCAASRPPFTELVIDGTVGQDDFAINSDNDLVLSQRALDILNTTNPVDTEVVPLDQHGRPTASA